MQPPLLQIQDVNFKVQSNAFKADVGYYRSNLTLCGMFFYSGRSSNNNAQIIMELSLISRNEIFPIELGLSRIFIFFRRLMNDLLILLNKYYILFLSHRSRITS